ncbi:(BI)-1-like superfamily incomplete domain protein [Mollivirus kamchatka]|nr:(BI)-1-like superfamily incomplete domain protein [Mollivirus kamchatka]
MKRATLVRRLVRADGAGCAPRFGVSEHQRSLLLLSSTSRRTARLVSLTTDTSKHRRPASTAGSRSFRANVPPSSTPLIPAKGYRFGPAVRSMAHKAQAEKVKSGTNNKVWLIAGGVAALGVSGVALAGYLSQDVGDNYVTRRLRATYGYTLGGLVVTAASAFVLFRVGVARRVLTMNPWHFMGASLCGTLGSLVALHYVPVENTFTRWVPFWLLARSIDDDLTRPTLYLGRL